MLLLPEEMQPYVYSPKQKRQYKYKSVFNSKQRKKRIKLNKTQKRSRHINRKLT